MRWPDLALRAKINETRSENKSVDFWGYIHKLEEMERHGVLDPTYVLYRKRQLVREKFGEDACTELSRLSM